MQMPIRVYNKYLDLLGESDTYQSMQYKRSYHSIGDFEMHINRYMHHADRFQKGNIIALNKQAHKAGLILSREIELDDSGKESENFKLTGFTLDGLMNRRVTVPPSGTAYDRKSGDAETVMKHYVYQHFVNPADPNRKMDMLEIAENQHRGGNIEWESRFKNVGDELEKISTETGLGWGIFVDFNTKKLIFDCFQAKNLTQSNNEGNSPVFFSPEFETIKSQSFFESDKDYKNVGYVGGQGEGADRKIIELGNSTGLDRIETFIDARDIGTEDEESEDDLTDEEIEEQIRDRGKQKMKEMKTLFTLEAEILTPITRKSYKQMNSSKQMQATPFEYEKDFDLGDRVQVVNRSWGVTMDAPITEFTEIHEADGFNLEATFGESRPTLTSKIRDKFNELEGIEKQEVPAQLVVQQNRNVDRKLTKEQQERIKQARDNLQEAKKHAEDYTGEFTYDKEAIDNKDSQTESKANKHAESKAKDAEENAKNFSKDASNITEGILDVGSVPIQTAYNGARIAFDGINGFVQYDKDNNPVAWFDLEGNARFSGDITGSTGTFGEVTVVDGDFSLKDDNTSTIYSATPKRNILKDHSFELIPPDNASEGQESHDHNWLEIKDNELRSFWQKVGKPKVTAPFNPDNSDAFAIFGQQGVVVRNGDYVRQYIYEGIGAESVYTVSGHFKKQWRVDGEGIPRIEIWHVGGAGEGGRQEKIINSTFNKVKSDYTVERHATTFTVPSSFKKGDALEIIISGVDSNWIQCDGMQMVEGNRPSVYQPEDSIWQISNGDYRPMNNQGVLWSGEVYPTASQTVTPRLGISDCPNGWILEWSGYNKDDGLKNTHFQYTFVPKSMAIFNSGKGMRISLERSPGQFVYKYIYVYDAYFKGHDSNDKNDNHRIALRMIYEW